MGMAFEIISVNAEQFRSMKAEWLALLRDVVDGGASVSFLAPLDPEIAEKYWATLADELEQGDRVILVARVGDQLAGSTQLALRTPPNGVHRAEVQKMLVHSAFRRRGLGRALLQAIDDSARAAHKTLLVLDTERGSAGEALYENYGYVRVGIVPQFALDTSGQRLCDTVIFYRSLV
jgi:GNAT superfamily N-acetyltransferase